MRNLFIKLFVIGALVPAALGSASIAQAGCYDGCGFGIGVATVASAPYYGDYDDSGCSGSYVGYGYGPAYHGYGPAYYGYGPAYYGYRGAYHGYYRGPYVAPRYGVYRGYYRRPYVAPRYGVYRGYYRRPYVAARYGYRRGW